jgi:hypothetical protein
MNAGATSMGDLCVRRHRKQAGQAAPAMASVLDGTGKSTL